MAEARGEAVRAPGGRPSRPAPGVARARERPPGVRARAGLTARPRPAGPARADRGRLATIPVMVNLPGLAGSPRADRCLVMGVVNVTPDSFSDGGRWFGADAAIEHGLELIAQGADIIDVGGESTRPGAQRIPADEELRRVKPVITELVKAGAVVSVDTMRAQVARMGGRGGRQPGQRCQRRARRPVHAPAGGEGGRALRRDALARAQPRHGEAGRLRRTWSARCTTSSPSGSAR